MRLREAKKKKLRSEAAAVVHNNNTYLPLERGVTKLDSVEHWRMANRMANREPPRTVMKSKKICFN